MTQVLNDWYHLIVTPQLLGYLPELLSALFLGFLIGLERRARHKSAGVRTYMVIAASSALITLAGVETFKLYGIGDPARLSAQIMAGVGMIGAGVILRKGFATNGVTTAAMILLAVGAGIACGFELFALAFLAILLTLPTMMLAGRFLGSNEYSQPVTILCKTEAVDSVRALFGRHSLMGGWDQTLGEGLTEFTVQPQLTPTKAEELLERLMQNPDVVKAHIADAE